MEQLAERLKALSDPSRLRIVRLLMHGELCICDLMASLDLPQSTISRHMSFLKRSGWVSGRRSKQWVYYTLCDPQNAVQAKVLCVLREELPGLAAAQADFTRLHNHLISKTASCE